MSTRDILNIKRRNLLRRMKLRVISAKEILSSIKIIELNRPEIINNAGDLISIKIKITAIKITTIIKDKDSKLMEILIQMRPGNREGKSSLKIGKRKNKRRMKKLMETNK